MFKVKNLRKTQKILDIQVTHNCKMRTLHLNQTHYMDKVLKNLHMQPDKHRATSISLNKYDALHLTGPTDQRIDQRQYQQAIKSLMYAAIHTQPDITFTLG